jgi:hypothetical protein
LDFSHEKLLGKKSKELKTPPVKYVNNLELYIHLGECAGEALKVAQPIKVLGDKLAGSTLVLLFPKIASKDGNEY